LTPILPLLTAAALVGILHMSAPDHWVTLVILGQNSRWTRSRLLGVSAITAVGHVGISLVLGFAIVVLGFLVSKTISNDVTEATGILMVVAGGAYGINMLLSHEHEDYRREAEDEKRKISVGRDVRYFAVLGGALSPDLSILPILLLAVPVGTGAVVDTVTVFSLASVSSLLLLVVVGSMGFSKVFERLPAKYNDALVGFVIAAVGAYILLAG
jgi:hypothetical protein